jgi:hypothetical protein
MSLNNPSPIKQKAIDIVESKYNVKVSIKKLDSIAYGESCCTNKRTINISSKVKNINKFVFCLFHEAGHFYCYDNHIYPAYHRCMATQFMTQKQKRALILTAWKAEKYVDNWANSEMKKYFPELDEMESYTENYKAIFHSEWLYKHYKW